MSAFKVVPIPPKADSKWQEIASALLANLGSAIQVELNGKSKHNVTTSGQIAIKRFLPPDVILHQTVRDQTSTVTFWVEKKKP